MTDQPAFLGITFSPIVFCRPCLMTFIVGSLLILINHGDALLRGEVDRIRLFRIAHVATGDRVGVELFEFKNAENPEND